MGFIVVIHANTSLRKVGHIDESKSSKVSINSQKAYRCNSNSSAVIIHLRYFSDSNLTSSCAHAFLQCYGGYNRYSGSTNLAYQINRTNYNLLRSQENVQLGFPSLWSPIYHNSATQRCKRLQTSA